MKWYADNGELHGIKGAEIQDILLFGGIIVRDDADRSLRDAIEQVKGQYAHRRAPVKWNVKDLKKIYRQDSHLADLYRPVLESAREWRRQIFQKLVDHEVTILLACIEAYSPKRAVIRTRKDDLAGYVFSNGLMRFGQHVSETKPVSAEVLLDWPDKGQSKIFDREYSYAYTRGTTRNGQVVYDCGPLSNLPFADSPRYLNMHHSTLLQAADLVVGATREVVECCLRKKEGGQGVDCARIVRHLYRGAPANVVSHGLSISTGNAVLRQAVSEGMHRLIYSD